VELKGVPNLYRVTENIYRSGQPSAEGFRSLEALGVKTVLNLRDLHHDRLRGTALRGVRIKMRAWNPERADIVRALKILSDKDNGPFLVHCRHGADRTGLIMAMYRMAVQGWEREKAIEEMIDGGYKFHAIWTEIPQFLRQVDVAGIKAALFRPEQPLNTPGTTDGQIKMD
jgi:protein tyrosine/serine phosphatase